MMHFKYIPKEATTPEGHKFTNKTKLGSKLTEKLAKQWPRYADFRILAEKREFLHGLLVNFKSDKAYITFRVVRMFDEI